METPLNALGFSHQFIAAHVAEGDLVVDATAGRGRDTVFLASLVGKSGRVLAFDVQEEAIRSTEALVRANGFSDRVKTILDDHANLASYVSPGSVKAVMFNLGWLPGGDHNVFSRPESSIPAIKAALEALCSGGAASVCIYCGKECGYGEKNALLGFFKTVDSSRFTVCVTDFVNRTGDFPIPVFILKRT
ncbi:MAG: methyltransferase domain-containing protein [Clostridia bacterium]|nr:methyltransferase domain-containing protein [Clostridia bacterium]